MVFPGWWRMASFTSSISPISLAKLSQVTDEAASRQTSGFF